MAPAFRKTCANGCSNPSSHTKDAGKGTGLGLSLTADILTRHGGAIEVESEIGAFTEMRLRLPLQPSAHRELVANED